MATTTAPNQITTSDVSDPLAAPAPNTNPNPPQAVAPPMAPAVAAAGVAGASVPVTTQEGVGTEGEFNVWEARYAMRNFLGRGVLLGLGLIAWIALALYTWEMNHSNLAVLTWVAGAAWLVAALLMLRRVIIARYSHYYRLTNRRLFVSTGLLVRRRDQMELLRVQDVYTRQTLFQRWLSLGTVVVVSTEPQLPMLYLTGVSDPKGTMDLIWHYARAERDKRSVKVDAI